MHIVYLNERIDITGGIERSLTTRSNYLSKKYKYKITIVCTEKITGIPAYKLNENINLIFLEPLSSKKSVLGRIYLRFKQSQKILKGLHPDIVISVKYTLHNFFFRLIPTKTKLISEIREPLEQYNASVTDTFKSKFSQQLRNFVLKQQDVMIVLTEADKKSWGYKNIKVVPNPKTIDSDIVSELLNPQVLAIGRLHKVKGFTMLLDVWKIVSNKHPNWILKICGEGEEYQSLVSKTNDLGLSNTVVYTNKFLPVVPEFLNSSIFVLTSQFEAFGNVLVESKICGVPIVAFDAPNGPREIIAEGQDGFVVGLNDIEAMASKIIYLIENQVVRKKMGLAGRQNCEKYNVETIIEQYNDLLVNCLKK
jgi:glycosyltransferase involved in cell wall biosynthesis